MPATTGSCAMRVRNMFSLVMTACFFITFVAIILICVLPTRRSTSDTSDTCVSSTLQPKQQAICSVPTSTYDFVSVSLGSSSSAFLYSSKPPISSDPSTRVTINTTDSGLHIWDDSCYVYNVYLLNTSTISFSCTNVGVSQGWESAVAAPFDMLVFAEADYYNWRWKPATYAASALYHASGVNNTHVASGVTVPEDGEYVIVMDNSMNAHDQYVQLKVSLNKASYDTKTTDHLKATCSGGKSGSTCLLYNVEFYNTIIVQNTAAYGSGDDVSVRLITKAAKNHNQAIYIVCGVFIALPIVVMILLALLVAKANSIARTLGFATAAAAATTSPSSPPTALPPTVMVAVQQQPQPAAIQMVAMPPATAPSFNAGYGPNQMAPSAAAAADYPPQGYMPPQQQQQPVYSYPSMPPPVYQPPQQYSYPPQPQQQPIYTPPAPIYTQPQFPPQ